MIAVIQKPQIESVHDDGSERWDLTLCVGKAFDFSIPFRAILQEIVVRLAASTTCELHMPAYQDREDFVSGTLDWGSDSYGVYYEYSLAYLDLSSRDKAAIDRLWACLSSIVTFDS
jgi:hypothetical protein